jgi:hypothetical protein
MKKFLILFVSVLFAFGVNAQVRFGVKAGGTLSNLSAKYDGKKEDVFKPGIGFNLGGVLEYSFSESIALQPELLYVMHNIKDKEADDGSEVKNPRYQVQSIQLPVNIKYKIGTEQLKFYVSAGPYLEYLASAKAKAESEGISVSVDLFNKENGMEMKHFNFGVGAGFGVEISKFTVGVGYQLGLANLTGADKVSMKNRSAYLSVGYFF